MLIALTFMIRYLEMLEHGYGWRQMRLRMQNLVQLACSARLSSPKRAFPSRNRFRPRPTSPTPRPPKPKPSYNALSLAKHSLSVECEPKYIFYHFVLTIDSRHHRRRRFPSARWFRRHCRVFFSGSRGMQVLLQLASPRPTVSCWRAVLLIAQGTCHSTFRAQI